MPVPAAIAIGAQLAPLALSFLGGRKPPDLSKLYQQYRAMLWKELGPQLGAFQRSAQTRGQAAGQNISSGIGRAGGGSSGVGATQRGLAAGAGTAAADESTIQFTNALQQIAIQLASQQAGLNQNAPTRLGSFQTALGGTILGGSNPFEQLAGMLFGGRGGLGKTTFTGAGIGAGPPPPASPSPVRELRPGAL